MAAKYYSEVAMRVFNVIKSWISKYYQVILHFYVGDLILVLCHLNTETLFEPFIALTEL